MSSSSMQKKYPEWLEKEQNEGKIIYYHHSQFNNVKFIGKGGFGSISSADYNGKKVALKTLNTKEATREFVNELKQLRANEDHPNINKLHGTTTDPKTGNLILVLQYANGGNLRQYLRSKWHEGTFKISLREIIKIAKQVTLGLMHLHKNNIIHCDLTLDKISEETMIKEFITNSDQKPIPILTRNIAPNLFALTPTVQTLNEPSLKNPKQTSPGDAIEPKIQVLIRYGVKNHQQFLKINRDDVDAPKPRGLTYFKQKNYNKSLETRTLQVPVRVLLKH
ncbi:12614_t:CDS:2, partial [Gigaspora rosea]